MNLIKIAASFALLAGFSLAEEKLHHVHKGAKGNPEKIAQVESYRQIFNAAEQIIIYEGLPHPDEEEELMKLEAKRNDTVVLPLDQVFYTPAVKADNPDAILKLLSGDDGISVNEPKKCGFHSDYCIQFIHKNATYRAFVCFGCNELFVMQGDSGVMFAFNEEKLKKLLAVYDKKRPKKIKDE